MFKAVDAVGRNYDISLKKNIDQLSLNVVLYNQSAQVQFLKSAIVALLSCESLLLFTTEM